MPDYPCDRLSGSRSRHQVLAALGALGAARLQPTQTATQLECATCGAAGAVCTHLKGCCEGLVCATSHISPTYGVCITGEGEHLAVTTQPVVPASDGGMAQMAAELVEAEEEAAAAETVLAEHATAKDSRRSTRFSRCGMDKAGVRPMVAARRPRC